MSGLLILSNYLRRCGHDARIFDFLGNEGETRVQLGEQLAGFRPELLVVCAMYCLEDAVGFLASSSLPSPHAFAVCMGTGALDYSLALRRAPMLDAVVPVNAEVVLGDVASAIEYGGAVDAIPGLARRIGDNVVFEKRPPLSLDAAVAGMKPDMNTSSQWPSVAYVWASRGCWYGRCTFCNVGAASRLCVGDGWAPRDVEGVVEEIRHLADGGVRDIHFLDAEFIGPGRAGQLRSQKLADGISQLEMDMRLLADLRVDCADDETMRMLKQAGLAVAIIGVESCCQSVLDRYRKGQTIGQIEHALAILRRWRIPFRCGWILADPLSTLAEVHASVTNARRLKLYDGLRVVGVGSVFHQLHLHAGTPVYEEAAHRCGTGCDLPSEIACDYEDDDVAEFIHRLGPLQLQIELRHRRLQQVAIGKRSQGDAKHRTPTWRASYDYSLRALAMIGVHDLLCRMLAVRTGRNGVPADSDTFSALLGHHDRHWLGEAARPSALDEQQQT